jgi:hypothetical protein
MKKNQKTTKRSPQDHNKGELPRGARTAAGIASGALFGFAAGGPTGALLGGMAGLVIGASSDINASIDEW